MEVDTRAGQRDGASATELQTARLHLSYLKSYTNMGTALVDCVSGCSCDPQSFTTLWEVKQSILKVHIFEVGAAVPGCLSLRTGGGWWHVHLLSLIMLLPPALKPKIPQQCAGVPAPTLPVASHHCRRGWAGSAGSAQGASALPLTVLPPLLEQRERLCQLVPLPGCLQVMLAGVMVTHY